MHQDVTGVKQESHQLVGQAKRRATKIRPYTIGGSIFGRFSNFDICRPQEADNVITGVTEDYVGLDVGGKFDVDESSLNSAGRII